QANVTSLGVADEVTVVGADVRAALKRLARQGRAFGLVLADPPYARDDLGEVLGDLVALRLLTPGAWVVLEHAARAIAPAPPVAAVTPLMARFTGAYGDTALTFYRWSNVEAA